MQGFVPDSLFKRRRRKSRESVSWAQRDFDPRRCLARALHARQNHAGGLPTKRGSVSPEPKASAEGGSMRGGNGRLRVADIREGR